jgi:hypothetical protein
VAPKEVGLLDEAMDMKYQITCVARSGRPAPVPLPAAHAPSPSAVSQIFAAFAKAVMSTPGAAANGKGTAAPGKTKTDSPTKKETPAKDQVALDITPGLNPMSDVRFMEVMIGTKRQFVLFNGPGNSPTVEPQDEGAAESAAPAAPAAVAEQSEQ